MVLLCFSVLVLPPSMEDSYHVTDQLQMQRPHWTVLLYIPGCALQKSMQL